MCFHCLFIFPQILFVDKAELTVDRFVDFLKVRAVDTWGDAMANHHFLSYSSVDAQDFAIRLTDALAAGPPSIPVWLDKRELKPGQEWDKQIVEAIRSCDSLLFVMTSDSVEDRSVCKQEWTRALTYKKPIVPLLLHRDAEMPFRLGSRQHIDFTGAFESALATLRTHLQWLTSPAGVLRAMMDRLADARRDARRAHDAEERARIDDEIVLLERQIADQQRIVDDPQRAARRVEDNIARGLEHERRSVPQIGGVVHGKFINPPPSIAPTYFQDRSIETQLLGDFLKDKSKRLLMVVGRAGIGKTAMVCRGLRALEGGQLPGDGGPLSVDGIVYLSASGSRRVTAPNLFADLTKLLPDGDAQRLDALYKDPRITTEAKMCALLEAFPNGRVLSLLDNFEDVLDPATQNIRDAELDEALRALLMLPHHAVKVILTTRIAPRDLALVQPGRQTRLELDQGLESPYAENILREMDADGKVGLKFAPGDLLAEARERTLGYPRALEALFAILSVDRYTTLREVLSNTERLLPENVVEVLVGEAFSRLDPIAQKVMQALAVCTRPVTPAAVAYLLQPYLPGVDSAPVLNRLVSTHFARREASRYYLHPVDRVYAFARVPRGEQADRLEEDTPLYTQFALWHRGAEYFKRARKPREEWKTLEDLEPQLGEFDLRCAGQDYDTAAVVLEQMSGGLITWGLYRLTAELHNRLEGKLRDPRLKWSHRDTLGRAYHSMGHYGDAITCYEQALSLARELDDRGKEVSAFCGLGWCYCQLGHTAQAIRYGEQALPIARALEDRFWEATTLSLLGWYYGNLGETSRAIDYCEQACAMIYQTRDRLSEGLQRCILARVLIDQGRYDEAIQLMRQSAKVGDEFSTPNLGNWSHGLLALAYLYTADLAAARAAAEAARHYDEPENNHNVLALLGIIALRQGDQPEAQEAFAAAVARAEAMVDYNAKNYDALDTKGLALCGLTLCGQGDDVTAAIEAYGAARRIIKDAGVVGRVLRLLEALAPADSARVLVEVRTAAGG
jgi:tetratricopeptide (TPR) repeat protein